VADDKKVDIRKVIADNSRVSDVANLAQSGVKKVKVLDENTLFRMIEQAVDEAISNSTKEERSRILADSRKQLTKLMNERDEVTSRANLAEAGRNDLLREIEKLQKEVKLRREVDEQEGALRAKTEELAGEITFLRETNDKHVAELDKARAEIKRLKARIAELEAELKEARGAGATAVAAVRQELARAKEQAAGRQAEMEALRKELAEAQARAEAVEEESANVQGSADAELTQARKDIQRLKEEAAAMRAHAAEQENAQAKVAEAQKEAQRLRDEAAAAQAREAAALQEAERLRKDLERAATAEVLEEVPENVPIIVLPSEGGAAPPPEPVAAEPVAPPAPPAATVGKPGKGLDVGTVNLVSAETNADNEVEIRQQRNVFIDVEVTPYTKAMLNKLEVPYFLQSKRMYVIGEQAFKLANVLNRRTRRPMKDGLISPKEQEALPIMKLLIGSILGEPRVQDEVCFYSVPGDPVDSDLSVAYHRDLFDAVLKALGYKPSHILEGHAVTFAELMEEDFTGIGVSCGGGMFNVCVVYKSLPALSFSTSRSGDWIDANVAKALNVKPEKAAQIKEEGVDLMSPKNREQDAIAIYYRNLLQSNLNHIAERFRSAENMPTFAAPVSLVFSGGTAMAGNFIELAKDVFAKLDFPIPVKEIRLAGDPLNATAKGALVAAQLEMASRPE
jgi:hypothetical protein